MRFAFFSEKREAVFNRWLELMLESYPSDAASFFREEPDRFKNPVGYVFRDGVESLLDLLLGDFDDHQVQHHLDRIIRVRAVQDLTPAEAVSFMFLLKKAAREELDRAEAGPEFISELLELESRIDRAALMGFEIYMGCREQIYRLRQRELQARMAKLLERTGVVFPSWEDGEDGKEE